MIDLPTTTPILTEIFGTADYLVRGGGGDSVCRARSNISICIGFRRTRLRCRPNGCSRRLHSASNCDAPDSDELDLATQRLVVERTPPLVTINFLLSTDVGERADPPDSRHTRLAEFAAAPADEPEWMRLSTLVGAPAGAGVFRDIRAWHGGTPNLSRDVRPMPNIEYVAPWFDPFTFTQSMPHEMWTELSPHAQRICRMIICEPGVWPRGAGVMHPLASAKRKEAFERVAVPDGRASK